MGRQRRSKAWWRVKDKNCAAQPRSPKTNPSSDEAAALLFLSDSRSTRFHWRRPADMGSVRSGGDGQGHGGQGPSDRTRTKVLHNKIKGRPRLHHERFAGALMRDREQALAVHRQKAVSDTEPKKDRDEGWSASAGSLGSRCPDAPAVEGSCSVGTDALHKDAAKLVVARAGNAKAQWPSALDKLDVLKLGRRTGGHGCAQQDLPGS